MRTFQQTISKECNISGIGLHTGKKSTLKFISAKINHGIKFQRIYLDHKPIIKADVENVIDISTGTK